MINKLLLVGALVSLTLSVPFSGRIIGGDDAIPGQFPYQVSLRLHHLHHCGGSIIDNQWILTAAHCVSPNPIGGSTYPVDILSIRAGSMNRIAGGVIHEVEKIVINKKRILSISKDIALLKLKIRLAYTEKIQPIELITEPIPDGSTIVISGWGLDVPKGNMSPFFLQYLNVKTLSTADCKKKVGIWSDSILCLSHSEGVGACHGDSGGPAAFEGKLAGIAAFVTGPSLGCASSSPDGYTKVSSHIQWIRDNMK